ncbi:MAG TPA: hypothetical protein PLR60_09105 [Syntrophorhabdaceae bacterium]|nr:hypothetical protein [Syntrophorhabdaceae bacterium]
MNRVFMTGKVEGKPRVVYTPRGDKYMLFPMRVREGDLLIDVECASDLSMSRLDTEEGSSVMVSGMLTRLKIRSREVFKLKAQKIFWMEE